MKSYTVVVWEVITGIRRMPGWLAAEIVTIAFAWTLPDWLEAVSTYWVVLAGVTDIDPLEDTVPIPGCMLTIVALDTLHVSVEELPDDMLAGEAVK